MCGRFTLTSSPEELARRFGLDEAPDCAPRYNIAPGQEVGVVRASDDPGESGASEEGGRRRSRRLSRREWASLRWGLVPSWAEDPSIGTRMINARAETASAKPAFREAFRRRRCLIPADGFYEWVATAEGRQAHHIHAADRRLLAFAGLWERRQREDAVLESCTILTTEACPSLRALHDRMPVMLPPDDYARWLDPARDDPSELARLLGPARFVELTHHPVSARVNSPRFDDAACAAPAPAAPRQETLF